MESTHGKHQFSSKETHIGLSFGAKNPARARHPQASRVDTLVVIIVVIVLAVLVADFVVVDSAAAGSLRWSDQCAGSLSQRINAALSLVPCQVRSNE